MPVNYPQPHEDAAAGDPISISRLARTLKRYLGVILLSLLAVMIAYCIGAVAVLLFSERERTTSLRFRLEFRGAEAGQYPNGLKFGISDIIANPVLLDVYNGNHLSRFVTFDEFSRSLYVLESNETLQRLSIAYEAKLADRNLGPIDRERIEREFDAIRAAATKSDYSLQFSAPSAIPRTLVPKILDNTLSTWARRAAVEKRVLDYHVSVLTPNILEDVQVQNNEYLVPLLLLRRRVNDVMQNVGAISAIPGAELVRTTKERMSLAEIQLSLDELNRFRLEPLIAEARAGGMLGSTGDAIRIIRAQLSYDQRALSAARSREAALRNALMTYESTRRIEAPPAQSDSTSGRSEPVRETVMPQISDTFLERVVDLASTSADREYRQRLTDEIKMASLEAVPLEAAVRYDQELIDSFQAINPASIREMSNLDTKWKAVIDSVRTSITQVNEIYQRSSQQLNPETEIYSVLAPPSTRIAGAISPLRLALGGVLTFLIAVAVILVAVLIHARMREEELAERAQQTS